jgi:predicted O-methyltransferase YrrM
MNDGEALLILDEYDTHHVGGTTYCHNLYMASRMCNARFIFEFGFGWGCSAMAFIAALSHTKGRLISLDPFPMSEVEPVQEFAKGVGVDFVLGKELANTYHLIGSPCVVYIDGHPNDTGTYAEEYKKRVRKGGLLILDGYGGQQPVTEYVDSYSNYFKLPYCKEYSHAISIC